MHITLWLFFHVCLERSKVHKKRKLAVFTKPALIVVGERELSCNLEMCCFILRVQYLRLPPSQKPLFDFFKINFDYVLCALFSVIFFLFLELHTLYVLQSDLTVNTFYTSTYTVHKLIVKRLMFGIKTIISISRYVVLFLKH